MNKTSWIIVASVLIAIGVVGFLFNNFFVVNNWKIVLRSTYESVILKNELARMAQLNEPDKQIEVAEQLLSRKNDNQSKLDLADAYLEKASLEFKEEEFGNKALALVNEVIANEPNNYKAYLTLGYAYEVLQDYSKSLENYNKAIEINTDSDLAYVKRGHAYDLFGDLVSAEADYAKALQLNNLNDVALMNLARIAQRKGDLENAKKYAEATVKISQISYVKATAYEIIGLVELSSENYQSAVDDFSKSIESYSNYGNAYANRAYAKIVLADFVVKTDELKNGIEADILKALEINKGSSFANVVEGILMQASGDKQKASEAYNKALSLVDTDITLGAAEKSIMKDKINQSIINNK
jgi:tetratricopeptide (TPR) repeat protein